VVQMDGGFRPGAGSTGGAPYGSVYQPTSLGSGGNVSGGGAIKLVTSSLTNDGSNFIEWSVFCRRRKYFN